MRPAAGIGSETAAARPNAQPNRAAQAPHSEQYSYELCRRHIDCIVTVTDNDLRAAMRVLFDQLKLAVEPACAAATAALLGPLREIVQGKRVGVLLCGTNTDPATFADHLAHAR